MPRKKKKEVVTEVRQAPEPEEPEPPTPNRQKIEEKIEEEPAVDVEKVKLQIFKDSITKLMEQAPRVIDVKDNPMLYGEFLNTLKRSLT